MIDVSELTEAQKATEGFKSTYAGMMNLYNQPGFITALCAHEAAHLIFYERMGRIPFEIVQPKIYHNDAMNRFEGYMAAVKPNFPIVNLPSGESGSRRKHLAALPGES